MATDNKKLKTLGVVLLLILVMVSAGVSVYLRIDAAKISSWQADQSASLWSGLLVWKDGVIPQHGLVSSTQAINPPGMNWFALPFTLPPDPYLGTIMLSLVQLLALVALVVLMYRQKKYLILILPLIILNPMVIFSSIEFWNQVIFITINALLVIAIYRVVKTGNERERNFWFAVSLIIILISPAIYFAGVTTALAGISLLVFYFFKHKLPRWKHLLIISGGVFLAVFLLVYVPYLRYESRTNWASTKILLAGDNTFHPDLKEVISYPVKLGLHIYKMPERFDFLPIFNSGLFTDSTNVDPLSSIKTYNLLWTILFVVSAASFEFWLLLKLLRSKRASPPEPSNNPNLVWLVFIFVLLSMAWSIALRQPLFMTREIISLQYVAFYLLIMAAAPLLVFNTILKNKYAKLTITVAWSVFLCVFAINNFYLTKSITADNWNDRGGNNGAIGSADVPIVDKVEAVDYIATKIPGRCVQVDYDFKLAAQWAWVAGYTPSFPDFSAGRALDYTFYRKHNILNTVTTTHKSPNCGDEPLPHFLITYTKDPHPIYSPEDVGQVDDFRQIRVVEYRN